MVEASKQCDTCNSYNPEFIADSRDACLKGHEPQWFNPKHSRDDTWGWRRVCQDYKEADHD